ncbi:Paired amphipathic helix protein Sin3-like 2 [Camellia lanceoleosa]|uniref:Paired amphipathic helix protein Sin3-like 2 n=1 Tax=Camellia lanceoleosa TaxID=1840588 RepID=A0ACC0GZX0_9ERIC|nr:Paired amphipathic helix protein Sin3-like 2 [Camellia lanceoleosa]
MDWITKKSSSSKRDHNPYEQKLLQREDYLFEIDMVLRRLKSANKNAQRLVNDCKNENNCENSIIVENYFTIHDMRCIKKLYDKCGYEVIEILRRNPIVALNNGILAWLKEKLEKWIEFSFDVGMKWGEPSSDEFKKWKREPRKEADDVVE